VVAISLSVQIQGQGYPVLCLHGHPGSGQSMSVFANHLSRRFKVLAPDLRGYGCSQTQTQFSMTDHLLDIDHLLDQHQIDQCLILGWSLGGILAIEMALRNPKRVSGLILIATSARPWGNHPPITWQDNALTGVAALVNLLRPGWQQNIDWFGKRSLFRYLIQQHTPEAYAYLAREAIPAYLQTSRQATRALFQSIQQGYNRLSDLPQIQTPCLVLAGACDRHITAASSQEMLQHLPNAQWHCYPNTAHLFPWEVPTQVLADIDQWIQHNPQVVTQNFSPEDEAN